MNPDDTIMIFLFSSRNSINRFELTAGMITKVPDVIYPGTSYCSLQFFNLNFMGMMKKILFLSTMAKDSGSFGMMKKLLLGAVFSLAMIAGKAQQGYTYYRITDVETGNPVTGYELSLKFTSPGSGWQNPTEVPGGGINAGVYACFGTVGDCGRLSVLNSCVILLGDPNSCMTANGITHNIQLKGRKAQLIIRDDVNDIGIQPNPAAPIWTSPDLWNRRDGVGNPNDDQGPGYGGGGNLMKVRIKNIGCTASQESHVRLYWTLGATGEHWPDSWNGNQTLVPGGDPAGKEIKNTDPGPGNIYDVWTANGYSVGPIQPGTERVIQAKWYPSNPVVFNSPDVHAGSMICYLARIDDPANEPMFSEISSSTASTTHNVQYNNNIATRNSSLVNLTGVYRVVPGGGILVNNYLPERTAFNVRLTALTANDLKFADLGTIRLNLGESLWNAWMEGGHIAEGVEISNYEAREVTVNDLRSVVLKNISIERDQYMGITPSFELTTNNGDMETYSFAFSQEKADRTEDEEAYGSECVFIVTVNGEEQTNEGGTFERQSTARRPQVAGDAGSAESGLLLYPNPSNDMVTISFAASANDKTVNVRITDMSGKLVQQSSEKVNYQKSSSSSITINTKAIKSGIYIVSVQAAGSTQSAKLNIRH
jgi:hypothetical protein